MEHRTGLLDTFSRPSPGFFFLFFVRRRWTTDLKEICWLVILPCSFTSSPIVRTVLSEASEVPLSSGGWRGGCEKEHSGGRGHCEALCSTSTGPGGVSFDKTLSSYFSFRIIHSCSSQPSAMRCSKDLAHPAGITMKGTKTSGGRTEVTQGFRCLFLFFFLRLTEGEFHSWLYNSISKTI